jgi:RNA polymerase subunit RPABC4/transcription elongation factor Spt4
MLYCKKCQVLSKDGRTCPLCGSDNLRPAAAEDAVLLYTAQQEEAERIAAAFDDAGIPHMERILEDGSYSAVVLGHSRCASMRIFVPFGEIAHAREVMLGIGALKNDGPSGAEQRVSGQASREETEKPMSRWQMTAIRILSMLLFFLLVAVVVFASDSLVGVFQSLFH